MIKKIFLILILLLFFGNSAIAASSSIKASEIYVIAGKQTVKFTCEVMFSESENPESVTIGIDYENDEIIDDSRTLRPVAGMPVVQTFYHVFPDAGFWDTVTTVTVEGKKTELDPLTINVAKWRYPEIDSVSKIGGIQSTPAVGETGTIYVGSEDGYLYAINPNGTQKWAFQTDGPINSTPAIDSGGYLYFGSADGYLYCLTPDNPGTRWVRIPTDKNVFSSPALSRDENTVYIASTDAGLYAVDTETGNLKWPRPFATGSRIVSSPAVGFDGTIYVGSLDNFLYAVHPNGGLKWKKNLQSGIYGGIALDEDGTIYVGTTQYGGAKNEANKFYAISSAGQEKWQAAVLSGFASTPVLRSDGTICVGSYDNRLYAFDRDGYNVWQFGLFADDILCAAAVGSNGLVYTASREGMIYALTDEYDYFTGKVLAWKYKMKLPVTTSSPVVANGTVYIGTYTPEEGALWAFAAESEEMAKELNYTVTEADPDSPWPLTRNDKFNSGRTAFTAATIAPAVVRTDPANGAEGFDVSRTSIRAVLSKPIDPDLLIADSDDPDSGFYGFTVSPFNQSPEEFEIRWVSDVIVELVLPAGAAFEKDVTYTAILQTCAPEISSSEGASEGLLNPYAWQFSNTTPEKESYSNDRGCFIQSLD